jgi:ketosteroid isomerase-like protein
MTNRSRARTVHAFAAAFATCDLDAVLACVSEDLVWDLNGELAADGRAAFEERMREIFFRGCAEITIEQLIEDGDVFVALNRGRFVSDHGEALVFVSAEAYTFTGDKVSHLQTYQPLG